MKIETLTVHAGHRRDETTHAVSMPIILSTTFEREPDGSYPKGFSYAREAAPNRAVLEDALAAIEGGAGCVSFSSGQAATHAILQALASGDHVLIPVSVYYGTPKLLRDLFSRWGLQFTAVDMRDLAAVRAAVRDDTKLIWIETPSNPLLTVTDIAGVAAIAHDAGARLAVDNTWATPLGQQPLTLGADLVMHATTKYLSGHSDVMGGAVVTRENDEFFERVRLSQTGGGAIPAPFDAWLVHRGLKTLAVRFRTHCQNAMTVARFLASHPAVEVVHYPGLESHPQHAVAAKQMRAFGGMASVQVRGEAAAAIAVAARVKLFTRATSLGGTESLIEHRASVEGPTTTTPGNLLRMSIGLEHPDDLIEDLAQALGV
jgi:cystathionine gamma-synthase